MAEHSDFDFVGGYDFREEAGLLHVADHHFSPGKKQWTWGCGDFGQAWDRGLTDADGPYIELMTGVYTENQPDFTWLKPFEEKTFTQYFMPYKKVGQVSNATINAVLKAAFEKDAVNLTVYATAEYKDAQVIIRKKGEEVYRKAAHISPVDIFEDRAELSVEKETDFTVLVLSGNQVLVEYTPVSQGIPEIGKPAEAAKDPEEILTNEELLLTAQHIEQHRHAAFMPDPYYLEGLKRDPGDIRINNAYGMLLTRRGQFLEAEKHFRAAIRRMTWRSPNPYTSEAYYNLGIVLFYQEDKDGAYDAFYKAAWSNEQQEMSYYYLALIDTARGNLERALELCEKGLVKNMHNVRARGLKASLLRKLGKKDEAVAWIGENLELDSFDFLSRYELSLLEEKNEIILKEMNELMRGFHENYLIVARDYADAELFEEAVGILEESRSDKPMVHYYLAYYLERCGKREEAGREYGMAEQADPSWCFPNKLEDIAVLEAAIAKQPDAAKAYYYLGSLYYDKLQFAKAIELWEKSVSLDDTYPTAHRNLALACYNKQGNPGKALVELEKAFSLDDGDARVFLELDQLYKKLGRSFEERLENYQKHMDILSERDDVMLEYVTLYNLSGQYERAYMTIMGHQFRPWEGAEGRISGQYKTALTELGKKELQEGHYDKAETYFRKALEYPHCLGEGRLEGTKDNDIHYYLGIIHKVTDRAEEAGKEFRLATLGEDEPAGVLYYYDQPADMIFYKGLAHGELGDHAKMCSCFSKLMDYGERHLYEKMKDDFFAVSLPDFMIFEEDMDRKNQAHCHYLMGLACLGLGGKERAAEEFDKAIGLDYNHQKARIYKEMTTLQFSADKA